MTVLELLARTAWAWVIRTGHALGNIRSMVDLVGTLACIVLSSSLLSLILQVLFLLIIALRASLRGSLLNTLFYLGYLTAHSAFHLLGYDHELGETEEKEMFQLQDILISRLYPQEKQA